MQFTSTTIKPARLDEGWKGFPVDLVGGEWSFVPGLGQTGSKE
jgi:hypothetical protein